MSKRKARSAPSSSNQDELEKEFLKETGLKSLDEIDPSVPEKGEKPTAVTTMVPVRSTAPVPPPPVTAEDLSAKTKLEPHMPLSMFYGFIGSRIIHPVQGKLSFYYPSCLMMDYIVHYINKTLCDDFYFRRNNSAYHPYVLRLYFGIIFWVQCLRAGNDVNAISDSHYEFLSRFLDCHPLETLAIPGPLVGLFKTICTSQPEFQHYGRVYPRVPTHPGPRARSEFMRSSPEHHLLPNVPGIFALLEDLNTLFTRDPPVYPKQNKHIPVTENATAQFGHKAWPLNGERTDAEKWSLVSPGLQYPCEADRRLNETFSERYEDFDFPATAGDDDLRKAKSFLGLKENMAWFNQVKEVANSAAASFEGSGTLADCSPHGLVANQIIVHLSTPETIPAPPRCIADRTSLSTFGHRLKSTAHNLPPLTETAAAYSQTHIRMYPTHPYLGDVGVKTDAYGPFWKIRPIASGPTDETSYLTIPHAIKMALKKKT